MISQVQAAVTFCYSRILPCIHSLYSILQYSILIAYRYLQTNVKGLTNMENRFLKLRSLPQLIVNILALNFSGNFLGTNSSFQNFLEGRRLFSPLGSQTTLPHWEYFCKWLVGRRITCGFVQHRLLGPTPRASRVA